MCRNGTRHPGVRCPASERSRSTNGAPGTGLRVTVAGERVRIPTDGGEVSGLLVRPPDPEWLLVLGHGAGAGMLHPWMTAIAEDLASSGIATLRYQFPYMERGSGRPDAPPILTATVRRAVLSAAELAPGLPLIAGGKSFGGRMTSTAAAERPLPGVHAIVFFGFPLHPPGRPATTRADHLQRVTIPMLFLQGTRDEFAELDLLRPVCEQLGARATLQTIDDADHSFHVPNRSGRTDADIRHDLVTNMAAGLPTAAE
jgi:predicted alpha/beta-hydrolase family hydrolase